MIGHMEVLGKTNNQPKSTVNYQQEVKESINRQTLTNLHVL